VGVGVCVGGGGWVCARACVLACVLKTATL